MPKLLSVTNRAMFNSMIMRMGARACAWPHSQLLSNQNLGLSDTTSKAKAKVFMCCMLLQYLVACIIYIAEANT